MAEIFSFKTNTKFFLAAFDPGSVGNMVVATDIFAMLAARQIIALDCLSSLRTQMNLLQRLAVYLASYLKFCLILRSFAAFDRTSGATHGAFDPI